MAIPASKIAALSSGEFVGMVADDPDNKIDLKAFHTAIQNDHQALAIEQSGYQFIPEFQQVDSTHVQRNYLQIKQDVEDIVYAELERMGNTPELVSAIVRKA